MTQIILPNVRKLFVPDPGYILFDADLRGADAQVVAWEAEDEDLKAAFRAGIDMHVKNAEDMWGSKFTSLPEGSHARYKLRQANKHAVHGTNYVGSPNAIAKHPAINWTIQEAEQFQKRWFSLHPGIKRWHQRIEKQLQRNRTIRNAFGFHRIFFDRADAVLPEAIAWIPQSTVAINTFKGALQLEDHLPQTQMLLQVHDSLVFQMPKSCNAWTHAKIVNGLQVETPYPDPLYIPWGLAASETSWGECKKIVMVE